MRVLVGSVSVILDRLRKQRKEQPVDFDAAGIRGEDQLPGGLADNADPSQFDQQELQKGVKVEMEHVDDEQLAQEIAMDHLTEDPKYYTKLMKVEKR